MAKNESGYELVDTLNYVHGGKLIRKNIWDDGEGGTFSTFDEEGEGYDYLPDGTILDPDDPPEAPKANGPSAAYNVADDITSPGLGAFHGSAKNYATQRGSSKVTDTPNHKPNAFSPPAGIIPGGKPPETSGSSTGDVIRNSALFNFGNPRQALMNAMLDSGMNPFHNTLYNRFAQSAAPGLMQAYMQNAATDSSVTEQSDLGAGFKGFLSNALGGGGDIAGILRGAASALPNVAGQLRQMQAGKQQGVQATINPIAEALYQSMSDPAGSGITNALMALNAPMMDQRVQGGYQRALGQNALMGLRGNAANPTDDIFKYLLGI